MTESLNKASEKLGLPPGTLIHVGEQLESSTVVSIVDYGKESPEEKSIETVEEIVTYTNHDTVTWVNVSGLHNTAFIESIGKQFDIHPLVLEDIVNTKQRSKLEVYEQYLFCVAKTMRCVPESLAIDYEQISIILMKNCVFTFKERNDELFLPIRECLDAMNGRFRNHGADCLVYVLLDTIVDQYFVINDTVDNLLESLKEQLLMSPSNQTLSTI